MKKSKHMSTCLGVCIKYWLAYCISIHVQLIYTHTLTRACDSVNSHTSHKCTHISDVRLENMPSGSTDSWFWLR